MTDKFIQKHPMTIPRTETGPIQFGDDWPGIFIRGDNAFAHAMYLRSLIEHIDTKDYIALAYAESLADLLESCNVNQE